MRFARNWITVFVCAQLIGCARRIGPGLSWNTVDTVDLGQPVVVAYMVGDFGDGTRDAKSDFAFGLREIERKFSAHGVRLITTVAESLSFVRPGGRSEERVTDSLHSGWGYRFIRADGGSTVLGGQQPDSTVLQTAARWFDW